MTKINQKLIAHLEALAKIEIPRKSTGKITSQLERIISYIEKLQEVDTADIEPTRLVKTEKQTLRKDVVTPGLSRDDALKGASETTNGFFRVPLIIDKEEE
jgi:aspartyl-tRNA(Asn)/glutamyl-tRNA(Gln) amidotransferase subunit C